MTISAQPIGVAFGGGQRIPPLEGGRNFRDLGGYPTDDGRRVKWGKLFRSGTPAALTRKDWDYLVARGIRTLCDLRTSGERTAAPFAWGGSANFVYWARDYAASFGALLTIMSSEMPTGPAAREAMIAGYRRIPFEQAPAYREIFARLKSDDVPLIFNCSAGKDRAGTAAALILTVLGVPRGVVGEDYLLSNQHLDFKRVSRDQPNEGSLLARQPPEVADAILNADPHYLDAAFEAIDGTCGSFAAYRQEVLGIDEQDVQRLRHSLLE